MAECENIISSRSEDDSSLQTDAIPLPSPPTPTTQARTLPEQTQEERPKSQKTKSRKKKSSEGKGFDNTFFKNGGFTGMFTGTNNNFHKGPTYYTHIESAGNVHIGPNITQVIKNKQPAMEKKNPEWKLPKHYFACEKPVTEEILKDASPFIGWGWKALGREFGFCEAILDTLEHDYGRAGMQEIVLQLMLKWYEENGKAATIGKLIEAFWKTNCRDTESKFETWLQDSNHSDK